MTRVTVLPGLTTLPLDIESIYRSHGKAVGRWAARLGGPGLDPEDIVQEVFLIAQRKLPGFRGDASPARWLYRITERVVAHRRRRERWRTLLVGPEDRRARDVPAGDPSGLEIVQRRQATVLFYQALDRLPETQRSAFILFELEELSGQQIADLKGVPVATVWVWLHRARAHFIARAAELREGPAAQRDQRA